LGYKLSKDYEISQENAKAVAAGDLGKGRKNLVGNGIELALAIVHIDASRSQERLKAERASLDPFQLGLPHFVYSISHSDATAFFFS
jgi:hypothetical protein